MEPTLASWGWNVVGQPYRVRVVCEACGARTYANTRTGLLYSHSSPGSTSVCRLSATPYVLPEDADREVPIGPPTYLEREPAVDAAQRPVTQEYPEESGQSLRAMPGGLPSLGKKR